MVTGLLRFSCQFFGDREQQLKYSVEGWTVAFVIINILISPPLLQFPCSIWCWGPPTDSWNWQVLQQVCCLVGSLPLVQPVGEWDFPQSPDICCKPSFTPHCCFQWTLNLKTSCYLLSWAERSRRGYKLFFQIKQFFIGWGETGFINTAFSFQISSCYCLS